MNSYNFGNPNDFVRDWVIIHNDDNDDLLDFEFDEQDGVFEAIKEQKDSDFEEQED